MGTLRAIEPLESRRLLADATATVVGNVFRDANGDGVRQSTEPNQAGIKVYLDLNGNGARDGDAEPLATTNADGRYTFAGVVPTTGLQIRLLLAGTNFQQTLPVENAPRRVTTVAGLTAEAERFGINEKTTTPPPVVTPPVVPTTVGGTVFTDRNRDGTRNDGEAGRGGVKVFLDTNNDGTREDGEPLTTTDSAGRYKFGNVAAGTTHVRLLLAGTNLIQTKPAGNAGVDLTVVANKENRVELFGVAETITTATVTGTVFTDKNGNGARDSDEAGRGGIRVYLDLNNNGTRDAGEPTTTTSNSPAGRYVFEHVPATTLAVRLDLSGSHFTQTLPANNAGRALTTVAGVRYTDQNFGVREVPPQPKGIVRGKVFNDANANGLAESGEKGVAGRIVYLDLNHNGVRDAGDRATTTNGEGRYTFDGVVAGTYDVRVYLGDYVQTVPTDNGARTVRLVAGATVGDVNFGVRLPK